jgi:hypothetical protein
MCSFRINSAQAPEDFELTKGDGKRTYDFLFQLLDSKFAKFQASTISEGYDASEYFTKYPGRFISMHGQGWSATADEIVPVGQDTLDWKRIFIAAKAAPASRTTSWRWICR